MGHCLRFPSIKLFLTAFEHSGPSLTYIDKLWLPEELKYLMFAFFVKKKKKRNLHTKHEPYPPWRSIFSALNTKQISNHAEAVTHAQKWAHKREYVDHHANSLSITQTHRKNSHYAVVTCFGLHAVLLWAHGFSSHHWQMHLWGSCDRRPLSWSQTNSSLLKDTRFNV